MEGKKSEDKKGGRLLSLDIMRGMTIAGMIMVNNPGSWSHIYAPLEHAEWLGLTPTDLVFPFFMFIMGVSTFFSLRKYDFKASAPAVIKVVRRAVVILLIGWFIGWLSRAWAGWINPEVSFWEACNNFSRIRTLGVLPRLAICYCVTALLALLVSRQALKWIVGVLLVGYAALLFLGNGFLFSADNVVAIVDRAVLGEAHMYSDTVGGVTLKFDPEGLLSTLPSIAHCIIGFLCGAMIVEHKDNVTRSYYLLIVGVILTFCGFLLDYGLPISKKLWTPTFVFTTCGLAASLLGLLIWVIDIRGYRRWCRFFHVFGINPLFLYVLSTILAIAFGRIRVCVDAVEQVRIPLQSYIYHELLLPLCCDEAKLASLCFAVLFVLLNWCVGYILYRKNIIIKI